MSVSCSSDVILLLGAGASVESGIPTSANMISKIESLVQDDKNWKKYRRLYNHVKSAIHYASGLKGKFGASVPFNIETLVNTLYELERNEEHPLYPFIATWNTRFVGLAGTDFRKVRAFRGLILKELKQWMCPEDNNDGDYYKSLIELQQYINFPLHIFSLNYDLSVERIARDDFWVESGFAGFGPHNCWDWERFEAADGERNDLAQIYLYKLHGSINWKRDENHNLYSVEQIENVKPENMEVIFGRNFKLEAADPYLFYAYQFRRFTLDARLIVTVGYGFADEHINKILSQALKVESERKLLVVTNYQPESQITKKRDSIAELLSSDPSRVEVAHGSAKDFFQDIQTGENLVKKVPDVEGTPF